MVSYLQWRRLLRSPYSILCLIFVVSRVIYFLLGVRFDARGLTGYFQFIDPELLRHHLLQSLFYLHMQPPGYNLFLGIILKLFPSTYAIALHAIHCIFGVTTACLLFYLMRRLRASSEIALTATALFIISPGVVLFENFILYEYQMSFILILSAVLLFRFFEHRSAASATGFLLCQFWLVMLRSQYHLVYFVVIFVLLLYFSKRNRTLVAGVGSLLLAVVLALYLKNLFVFGQFVSSTWLGQNITIITTHQLTPQELNPLLSQGKLKSLEAELSLHRPPGLSQPFPLSTYYPVITMPAKTSIPVLDQEFKSTGGINFNHLGYLQVSDLYTKEGLITLRYLPKAYLRSITIAWFTYFLPSGDFSFFELNAPRIHGIERFFDIIMCGQFKYTSKRTILRQMKPLAVIPYTGVFLLIGLPAVFIFGSWLLCNGVRKRTLAIADAMVLGFILFTIAYGTAVVNFLSCFENNRYRFPLDGLYLILAVLAIEHLRQKVFRRSKLDNR